MGMDDDGLFFFIISTFGRSLAATCLLDSYLGLLQHGRAVTSDAVQGSKTGTAAASRASCYIRCGIGVPQL